MAILYRPHRHLLNESLDEIRAFDNVETMICYVQDSISYFYKDEISIVIDEDYEMDDYRIGWHHTRYVCVLCNDNNKNVVGMCDTITFANDSMEEAIKKGSVINA